MAITISEAARRWGVGRETIYRKNRKGEISFTGEPPTVEVTEMIRVFGEPGSKKPTPSADNAGVDVAAQARADAERETLKAEVERLRMDLATAQQDLRGERDDARKDRERLHELLLSQQRMIEASTKGPTLLEWIGFKRKP